MTLNTFLAGGVYIDIILLLLIIISFIYGIMMLKRLRIKIIETEKQIIVLKKYQEDIFENLDKKYASLKEVFVDKTNVLTDKVNDLTKQFNTIHEGNQKLMAEIENKTEPLRTSISETEKTLRGIAQQNGREIEKLEKEISDFSKEIQKMKDDIRERTIDLEL